MDRTLLLLLLTVFASSAAAAPALLRVASADGTVSVSIERATGSVVSIESRGVVHRLLAGDATLDGTIELDLLVTAATDGSGSVDVNRTVCVRGGDVPCSLSQAWIVSSFVPRATSVGWVVTASTAITSVPYWTRPLVTNVSFASAGDKQFWAPWERGNDRDSLLPSDGGFGWWRGEYLLGAEVMAHADLVVHEHAAVLAPARDVGVSLIPNPSNPFAHPTWLNISGTGGGAKCATPGSCPGPGGFAVSRHALRFGGDAAPHVFDSDLVAHAACWRDALGWSARAHRTFWAPVSARMKTIEGLGSYSSSLQDLTDPKYAQMGYALNWDLSGRFFPYAGQFLPPVKRNESWLNDAEGTQARANVTFASIDAYYARIQAEGFHTLSYWNVNEYGENVCGNMSWNHHTLGGCTPSALVPSSTDAWANSSNYIAGKFPNALVTRFDAGGHSGTHSPTPAGLARGAIKTWQGGVVVDPADKDLQAHWLAQLERKYDELSHFEGLVVDRSDWNALYNFDFDDGASLVAGRPAHLTQYAYVATLRAMRALMAKRQGATRFNETVMLQNALGFAQLSLMEAFDGTFSEGAIVNAVGVLGAKSTTILWTGSAKECCASDAVADAYFQRRLYMNVFPMAPFPGADHSVAPSTATDAFYIMYGGMFQSLVGATWLLAPHAVNVSRAARLTEHGAATATTLVANAFELPHEEGFAALWAIMLGGAADATAATLSVAHLPPSTTAISFEAMLPDEHAWSALPASAVAMGAGNRHAKLAVQLKRGCAMIRVAPSPLVSPLPSLMLE